MDISIKTKIPQLDIIQSNNGYLYKDKHTTVL